MRDRQLDRLFDRFRRKQDTAALAQVFDATAPELLGLATHLVRDVGEGEDLLQQTFLTAIEKANRYDADRRLVPWLVGILVRHAHAARRKRTQTSTDSEFDLAGGQDPIGTAEGRELTGSVEDALSRLPAQYRSVLEPYLLRDERAVDIARSSGKSPGTVRVQIRRGLDELRRVLPVGLAAGTSALLGGQTLADVRATVLEEASRTAERNAPASATAVSSTTLLGGLALSHKIALGALALTLLTFIGWFVQRDAAPELRPLVDAHGSLGPTPSTRRPSVGIPIAKVAEEATLPASSERAEVAKVAASSGSTIHALAGAHGRVVDEFDAPVSGVSVRLLEMRPEMFESFVGAPFGGQLTRKLKALAWNPIVDEATTDADGKFTFDGAQPAGSHALGIDLGGERPSLRVVDRTLPSGGHADLGTIRLDPARTLRGQVLGFDQQPVAGARVRAASIPVEAEPLAEVRPGSMVILDPGGGTGTALEFPAHFAALVDLLPVPRTTTDEEGRFELEGVARADVRLLVDHPQFGLISADVRESREEAPSLSFSQRHTFSGRVLNAAEEVIAGAEVVFGERWGDEGLVVARGEVMTNELGVFQFDCSGEVTVAVRQSPQAPWTIVSTFQDGADVEVESMLAARVSLRDREGHPVTGASIDVAKLDAMARAVSAFGIESRPTDVLELGDGEYEVSHLTPGAYRARAQVQGFSILDDEFELTSDGQAIEFVLDRGGSHGVRVIEAGSLTAVQGANVSLLSDSKIGQSLTRGVTDAEGWVKLSGVPIEGEHELSLRVAHPAYAVHYVELAEEETTLVELSTKSEALLRLTVSGAAPLETMMVMLESQSRDIDSVLPTIELSDDRGHANFTALRAGAWKYSIAPRFLHHDALSLLRDVPPEPLATGTLTVTEGEQTIVDVELSPEFFEESQPAQGGGIEGNITVEGVEDLYLHVGLFKAERMDLFRPWIRVQSGGAYRFDDLGPGDYQVLVLQGRMELGNTSVIAAPQVELPRDRIARCDVKLSAQTFDLVLLDEGGQAVTDGRLAVHPMFGGSPGNPFVRSLGSGEFQAVAWSDGEYFAQAESPTAGRGALSFEFVGIGNERFEVSLSRGVPCAGELVLPKGDYPEQAWLLLTKQDRSAGMTDVEIRITANRAPFDVLGLQPGEYSGRISFQDGTHYQVHFELPEGGDNALELRVQAPEFVEQPGMEFRKR